MTENTSVSLRISAVFVLIGFLMTLGLVAVTLLSGDGAQLHEAVDPQTIINELNAASPADLSIRLAGLVFDMFFIVGYVAIFYGLYVLTKSSAPFFPKLAFVVGLATGFCDLIENAIQLALFTGIPAGWTPDGIYFASLWTFTFVKDMTSYTAGMIFIVLLTLSLGTHAELRLGKSLLIVLLGLYVVLGSLAIIDSSFLLYRSLSFMFDMLLGGILFHRMSMAFEKLP
ncbi:MAG: hypothetical protein AM324_005965 [Candidatus Thorarchaeota archaeon SMTZ1-83]|nr:MAG: hypothetical protein AM324_07110 [Candidatus Thorarchaeota archaeon SMTZ1-83]